MFEIKRVKTLLLTSLIGIMVIGGIAYAFDDEKLFQTNVLGALNEYVFGVDENIPDLGIGNVYLTKIASPAKDFPYYKFKANVTLRNYGGEYRDSSLVLNAGEGQKTAFVRNSIDGFVLQKGEVFVFEDYEVLMDAKVNYGEFTFSLESKEHRDNDPSNDVFTVSVFEEPAKLGTLSVKNIEGNEVSVESMFDMKFADKLDDAQKEVCSFYSEDLDGLKYAEVNTATDIFSYYKVKIDLKFLFNEELKCEKNFEIASGKSFDLKFDENKVYFLRAKIGNANLYALSNAIVLPKQEFMTNEEFAKEFVEYGKVPMITNDHYYLDVSTDSEYAGYVQAMYDNGLTEESMNLEDKDFTFEPKETVTRADILEPLLNYFDVDLVEGEGAPHFSDVSTKSKNYYFVEALYADGKGRSFSQKFSPEKRASKAFLKYLIDEFKKE